MTSIILQIPRNLIEILLNSKLKIDENLNYFQVENIKFQISKSSKDLQQGTTRTSTTSALTSSPTSSPNTYKIDTDLPIFIHHLAIAPIGKLSLYHATGLPVNRIRSLIPIVATVKDDLIHLNPDAYSLVYPLWPLYSDNQRKQVEINIDKYVKCEKSIVKSVQSIVKSLQSVVKSEPVGSSVVKSVRKDPLSSSPETRKRTSPYQKPNMKPIKPKKKKGKLIKQVYSVWYCS